MFGRKKSNLLALYAAELADGLWWQRRQRRRRIIKGLTIIVWTLAIVAALLIINLLLVLPLLKQALVNAYSGQAALAKTIEAIENGQVIGWEETNRQAGEDFSAALAAIKKINLTPLAWLPFTHSRLSDARAVLTAGVKTSTAVSEAGKIAHDFSLLLPSGQRLAIGELSVEQKKELITAVAESEYGLRRAADNLTSAADELTKVSQRFTSMMSGFDLVDWEKRLRQAAAKMEDFWQLARLLPVLAGYPHEAHYLFVLQNSDELRPTGGFIGTYGLALTRDGSINRLETHDVYHLDMPAAGKLKVAPPPPLKKYLGVDYWYLRDANWSPDWPTSARKIEWFWQQENQLQPRPEALKEFDFIIGLTPKTIIDLLAISGPLSASGQVYQPQNFVELLQDTTGKNFYQLGVSRWDRKAVIGDLARQLESKLLANLDKNWPKILETVVSNLASKDILVYSRNQLVDELLRQHGWRGEVGDEAGDFLLVTDANLAALKTDAMINRSLNYQLTATSDGLIAKLNIHYANNGHFSWKTTRYRTYTRVYVPRGSQLLKAAGYLGQADEVVSGEELGKTYFGAFTEIEPGKIGGLYFEYKLPYNLYVSLRESGYRLTVLKQPGSKVSELKIDLNFHEPIRQYSPAIFYAYLTGSRLRWTSDLNADKRFEVKF